MNVKMEKKWYCCHKFSIYTTALDKVAVQGNFRIIPMRRLFWVSGTS